jgi:predicted nucleic acid-binding protein
MNLFGLDASALSKRYTSEAGADRIDHLFSAVTRDRLQCLMLGAAEVVSVLVRRRNGGLLSQTSFAQALINLSSEVINANDFATLASDNAAIAASVALIEAYSINANDALILRVFLDHADQLRAAGNDLVLVASDKRLLKAGQAEGLATFDPEDQSLADLDALIKS